MPRAARNITDRDRGYFHVIARGNNGMNLCRYARDYTALKCRLKKYYDQGGIEVCKYSLMRTHIHLLVWIPDTTLLASTMTALQVSYFYHYKRHYNYRGHLWHHRYRCIPIESDEHLAQCGRYIEVNAVHAGIVQSPDDYRWSSYRFYAYTEEDYLVTLRHDFMLTTDVERRRYHEFIRAGVDHDYQRLKKKFEREHAFCYNSKVPARR